METLLQGFHPPDNVQIITSNSCCHPLLFLVITVAQNVQLLLLLLSCQSVVLFPCSRASSYIQSRDVCMYDREHGKYAHGVTDATVWICRECLGKKGCIEHYIKVQLLETCRRVI